MDADDTLLALRAELERILAERAAVISLLDQAAHISYQVSIGDKNPEILSTVIGYLRDAKQLLSTR